MGYVGDKKREYQRAWLKARRDEWIKEHGPCVDCGSWDNLEIDHEDPSTKEFDVANLWSCRKEKRDSELKKCVVRCEKCHLKKTTGELMKPVVHGKRTTYIHNHCRCNECVISAKLYRNEQRYRTGKRKRPKDAGLVQRQESLLGMEQM